MTTVLIVEDDPDIRDLVTTLLGTAVDEVLIAGDGEEALAIAARRDIDVVVLDLALPGERNGLDVLAELRASGHPARTMLLTAYAGAQDRAMALRAGADAFLPKPFKIMELVAQVQELAQRPAHVPPAAPTA
jgi:two-component system, OmpR family, response regulator